ncbi:SDR family NAD(P)-dependent oxidoreductase [Haliea sp. E1-2-M8]|uniref:SDR family oxidoreductase n=1 Tax=Haliea sp. E1-2-M8 TaxID=3064706 RepID=UPI00271FCCC5|nr:SDR family NAD(P)-dependent oxidoreductase [Haliea sp. E1-2-M8]MDO8863030.1 SDR family NAD(P)-dependent oxidoreductase [Haliea sp. E1-2-M8]
MPQWYVENKVVVVTGGSKGIGEGLVGVLLDRGAKVAVLARDNARLQASVAQWQSDRVVGFPVDVSDRDALDEVYCKIWEHFGQIDAVINNVGFQFPRRVELMPAQEVRQLVELNLLSTIFGCQAAIPWLRRNGGGRIVNISSATVRCDNEFAHLAVYTACKAAVDQFTAELRKELVEDNILVTLFSSGSVFTGTVNNFDENALAEAYTAWLAKGEYYGGSTTPPIMGAAIAQSLEYPPGIAAEFIEVKPGVRTSKRLEGQEDGA